MLDPLERWRPLEDKPDYAGFLTFGGAPATQDPRELVAFDVAIVGAPTDDLVSDRPGTRFAPRAAPGSADVTALAGDRVVRELLTGLAVRRLRGV